MKTKTLILIVSLLFVALLVGCTDSNPGAAQSTNDAQASGDEKNPSKDNNSANNAKEENTIKQKQEPVTITLITPPWTGMYKLLLTDTLSQLYPHITLDWVNYRPETEAGIGELLLAGVKPDLFLTSGNLLQPFITTELLVEHADLLKKYDILTHNIYPGVIESMDTMSGGFYKIPALPFAQNTSLLFYNKDIFNIFGVGYPRDGMTWDETIELARKITGTNNDIAYKGLHHDFIFRVAWQAGAMYINPATNEADLQTEAWRKTLKVVQDIYFSIPGNEFVPNGSNAFFVDRDLAMIATPNVIPFRQKELAELNWDIATYPSFPEKPGVGIAVGLHVLGLTSLSSHPDDAALVIKAILSDEFQKKLLNDANLGVKIENFNFNEEFGKNLPFMKGKNVAAINKVKAQDARPVTKYDSIVQGVTFGKMTNDLLVEKKDINTVLREAEEEANQKIAAMK